MFCGTKNAKIKNHIITKSTTTSNYGVFAHSNKKPKIIIFKIVPLRSALNMSRVCKQPLSDLITRGSIYARVLHLCIGEPIPKPTIFRARPPHVFQKQMINQCLWASINQVRPSKQMRRKYFQIEPTHPASNLRPQPLAQRLQLKPGRKYSKLHM